VSTAVAEPRLRPEPYPILPLGPFWLDAEGDVIKFKTAGPRVIRFIENNCIFTNGEWIGRPFRLLDWEKQLLLDLFELVHCPLHEAWCRRYRTALIGVGKKNGKTELIAALGLYGLLGDAEPAALISCAAAGDDQADLLFNAAATMARMSPTLSSVVDVWEREILVPESPNARLIRVPASGGRLDGKNIYWPLCDELHEWMPGQQEKTFGMMRGGMAARSHPLMINITTAGLVDEDLVWERLFDYGMKVQAGEIEDPTFFFRWWMAPEDCDYKDLSLLPLANPSYGVTVREEFYRDELTKRHESEYRRYYLNQPVLTETMWLPQGAWDACRVEGMELVEDKRTPTFIGWDGSTKYDSTAVDVVQKVDGKWRVKAYIWERPVGPDGQLVDDWAVPGAEVANLIRTLWREKHNVIGIAYDPAFITWLAQDLSAEGLPTQDWPQTDTRMIPATQAAYEIIMKGELEHDGDPMLARHIRNALAVQTSRGGQRLTKGKKRPQRKYIDGAIALLMALDVGMRTEPPRRSVYEDRGILTV
jgi:phage terminase large subunit-like protein